MEKLITVSDVRDRYGCSRQTARKYIRQCNPHMEKPLATPKWAFEEWERSRMVTDEEPKVFTYSDIVKCVNALKSGQSVIVPRRR